MALNDIIREVGEYSFLLPLIAGSLIVDAMQVVLAIKPDFTKAKLLLEQPRLRRALDRISTGKTKLILLMNDPEYRQCNCLAYIATAIELDVAKSFKTKITIDLEHCAVCKEVLAASKVCSACKEVAYCSVEHQRMHWKAHKKTCSGRGRK